MAAPAFGVHSETGTLREVIVCRPGLAHRRLMPFNCRDLLFDDVFWVKQAQRDHDAFAALMRERGVAVLELHDLLAETLEIPAGRAWLLERRLSWQSVGVGLVAKLRAWMETLPSRALADWLVGGVRAGELPFDAGSLFGSHLGASGCRRCPTCCSPATVAPGCLTASSSTPCAGPPGSRKPC